MDGYALARPLTLRAAGQAKTVLPVGDLSAPTVDRVHIAAPGELDLVRGALAHAFPDTPADSLLRVIASAGLATMPGFPVQLGAAGADASAGPACLPDQLRRLRAAQPFRRHFRFLLVNAFGGNLGDNLIGLTAFRHVLATLRAGLPAVSVDVLLGWHRDDRLERLLRPVDGIDALLTQGPTLAGLSRYQGYFDTSALLHLPRYGELAPVDWYLWWLGLDPDAVPAADKRNGITFDARAMAEVGARLPVGDGPRIVVNPRASVALRTMPADACRRIVARVLEEWPQARVLLTQPLEYDDPRVDDFSAATPTVDHLAALLARADGLIGVDTFTQHLADATDTPAATIFTSVEAGRYPCYPFGAGVLLPGARTLPGWGRHKTSPESWQSMERRYQAAWDALPADEVVAALAAAMERKRQLGADGPVRRPSGPGGSFAIRARVDEGSADVEVPSRRRDDPLAAFLWRTLANLGDQVLRRGDTAAVLGAGAGEAAVRLGRAVGASGRLVAIEPRRELHQLLCANLRRAGIAHAEAHAAMPEGEGLALRWIDALHLDDEHLPLQLGNCAQPEPVVCWPFDALELAACRLLAVCAPLPLLSVLRGARATLARTRPVVLAGPLRLRDAAALESFFADQQAYRVSVLELGKANDPRKVSRHGLLIAEPEFI